MVRISYNVSSHTVQFFDPDLRHPANKEKKIADLCDQIRKKHFTGILGFIRSLVYRIFNLRYKITVQKDVGYSPDSIEGIAKRILVNQYVLGDCSEDCVLGLSTTLLEQMSKFKSKTDYVIQVLDKKQLDALLKRNQENEHSHLMIFLTCFNIFLSSYRQFKSNVWVFEDKKIDRGAIGRRIKCFFESICKKRKNYRCTKR